ncbi:50S ribosomal protein L29 [Candidatus Woesebacteria bacterium]|jgi:ribosomal protein L29|nr:50S ribosomal protein L29 [Candidatus Woesebacteria bacterium]TEU02391.1 MAG: 50S ribosomal protein L29 [Candidatus Woesebacteria bacterium]
MKKKDLTDLRNKKINELEKLLSKKRNELINTYAKIKAGQEKNLKKAKNIRRDVAQILTIIREKELLKKETK